MSLNISNKIINVVPWSIVNKIDSNIKITNFFRKKNGKIRIILIHITDKCNFNCVYCYEKNNRNKGKKLSYKDICSIIKQSKKLGVTDIQFLGGEPFIYPKLKELLKYALDFGFNVTIYTNGSNINEEWTDFLKRFSKKIYLNIKFDSCEGYKSHLNKDIHNEIFEKIKTLKENDIRIRTYITVTRLNYNQIEELIRKSYNLKIFPVIERYLPVSSRKANAKLEITKDQWNNVIAMLNKYNKKYSPFLKTLSNFLGFNCYCYNSLISFDINGNASPCAYISEKIKFANIFDNDLEDIFSKYKTLKKEWNRIPKECLKCREKDTCKGGCKTYAYLKNNTFDNKDPFCNNKIPPNITLCNHNCSLLE